MNVEKMENDPSSRAQWSSYNDFIGFFKWSTVLVIVSLILMAIFLL